MINAITFSNPFPNGLTRQERIINNISLLVGMIALRVIFTLGGVLTLPMQFITDIGSFYLFYHINTARGR